MTARYTRSLLEIQHVGGGAAAACISLWVSILARGVLFTGWTGSA